MEHLKVASHRQAPALLANIRVWQKDLAGTNTLAYRAKTVSDKENKVM